MAQAILGSNGAARKPLPSFHPTSVSGPDWTLPGLAKHPLVSPDAQVRILDALKQTGSAPLSHLVAALPYVTEPVAAVLGLVETGVLRIAPGLIDGDSVLRLASIDAGLQEGNPSEEAPCSSPHPGDPETDASALMAAKTTAVDSVERPGGVRRLEVAQYQPALFIASGADRSGFRKIPELRGPGFYFAIGDKDVHVGSSDSNVGERISGGKHLLDPAGARLIMAITDEAGRLTAGAARAGERLLADTVLRHGEKPLRHELPDGDAISPLLYERLGLLVASATLAVRHAGWFFTRCPAKALTDTGGPFASESHTGPAQPQETGVASDLLPRRADDAASAIPGWSEPGLYALSACGVSARARVENGLWTVLTGSQVRTAVMPSASASARQRRAELLHSGALTRQPRHLLLNQDLSFQSASGAALFVLGTKPTGDIWRLLPPEAEFETPRR